MLSDTTDRAILKIADFGLSAIIFATETSDDEPLTRSQNSGQTSPGKALKPESRTTLFRIPNITSGTSYNTPTKSPLSEVAPTSLRRLRSVVGSPHYIAPEIAHDGNNSFFLAKS